MLSLALPAALIACGGGGEGDDDPVIEGDHHTYVVNQVSVPTNAQEQRDFALDVGARLSSEPDGTVDNQLGNTLTALKTGGFDVQAAIAGAVATGGIILLVDVQSTALTDAKNAGMFVKLGTSPNPAPCTDPNDINTCGQHLKGTGTFSIAANSPSDAVFGEVTAGGFAETVPGKISLQIAIGAAPITLNLVGARVKATGITDAGIQSMILAGALPKAELDNNVLPAIHGQLVPLVDLQCGANRTLPTCGCPAGSTGALVLGLFDTAPKDCNLVLDEIKANAFLQSVLSADVCTKDDCAAPDALSAGIKVVATKGTFPTQ